MNNTVRIRLISIAFYNIYTKHLNLSSVKTRNKLTLPCQGMEYIRNHGFMTQRHASKGRDYLAKPFWRGRFGTSLFETSRKV